MPAKSQQQLKFIYAMRNKYGSKKKAPKNMMWVFDEEWTSGVKMKKLPKKVKDKKNESIIMNFSSFIESNVFYEGSEDELFDDSEIKSCGCEDCNCLNCDYGCECGCCFAPIKKDCKWCYKEFTTTSNGQYCCSKDCKSKYDNYI